MQSVSFDVFETVIQRSVWPPSAVYTCVGIELQKAGLLSCTTSEFSKIREKAECKAFDKYGPSYNLKRIYSFLPDKILNEKNKINLCYNLEAEVELRLANPVPEVIKIIHKHRNMLHNISFVSDTYHDESTIKCLLEKVGAYHIGDRIFVSNNFGVFKHKGRLFKKLSASFNETKIDCHYGNSWNADVLGAAAAGIKSHWIKRGNATFLEAAQESFGKDENFAALLLGAQRLVRNKAEDQGNLSSLKIELATGLLAPLNIALLMWALAKAKAKDTKKLFLLSRDGWIMRQMAHSISSDWFEGFEIKYLYTSRQALSKKQSQAHFEYLKQEGVFSSGSICLVDVGWRGSLHECFCQLRSNDKLAPAYGYFLGLDECDEFSFANFRESMLKPRDFPDSIRRRIDSNIKFLVESMFCAPHGSVSDFHTLQSKPEPIFDHFSNDKMQEYGYGEMTSLAIEVFNLFASGSRMSSATVDADFWADYVKNLLQHFCYSAPREIASEIGDLPIELDQKPDHWLPLAPEIGWLDAMNAMISCQSPKIHDRQWSCGSWLRARGMRRHAGRILFDILQKWRSKALLTP